MLLRKGVPFGFLFRKIRTELLIITIYTVFIGLIDEEKILHLAIPGSVPTIIGTALALLLGFRTNQGYERWWEARIVWGAIVNDSRTLVRQLLTFTADRAGELGDVPTQVAHRQIAFCYALGNSLRGLDAVAPAQELVSARDLALLRRHDNVPNALLLLHGKTLAELLAQGSLNPFQQVQLDATVSRLCDSMGKCERIKNTVFPAAYNLLVVSFLYFFVATLPFALVDTFGLSEIPVVVVLAAIFFLIEKTAIYLQDPFENTPNDTPMTAIARTIDINLRQMLGDQQVPQKLAPEGYYLM